MPIGTKQCCSSTLHDASPLPISSSASQPSAWDDLLCDNPVLDSFPSEMAGCLGCHITTGWAYVCSINPYSWRVLQIKLGTSRILGRVTWATPHPVTSSSIPRPKKISSIREEGIANNYLLIKAVWWRHPLDSYVVAWSPHKTARQKNLCHVLLMCIDPYTSAYHDV